MLDETFEPREGVEPDVHGWLSTGEVPSSRTARDLDLTRARALGARGPPRRARSSRDGAVVVELHLRLARLAAREILKEAGDAVVLEPEDARTAVLEAAEALAGAVNR